jgi:hypothetical protein
VLAILLIYEHLRGYISSRWGLLRESLEVTIMGNAAIKFVSLMDVFINIYVSLIYFGFNDYLCLLSPIRTLYFIFVSLINCKYRLYCVSYHLLLCLLLVLCFFNCVSFVLFFVSLILHVNH